MFGRKQAELLNEKLHEQLNDYQKEITSMEAINIPGFTLISNETLKNFSLKTVQSNQLKQIRKQKNFAKKTKSFVYSKKLNKQSKKSKSDVYISRPTTAITLKVKF